MNTPVRILIADDHAVVRAGLLGIISLEKDFQVVGEAGDGIQAVEKAVELQPDVILMDILMPRANGLEALVAIREKLPQAKVLFLTVSSDESDLFNALRYGAQGYILKNSNIENVLEAIRMTAAGEAILSLSLATKLVAEFKKSQGPEAALTDREREVLRLTGEGQTNSEIAKKLFIEDTTVRTHLQRLIYKLHLKNRAEAIAYAQRNNLSLFRGTLRRPVHDGEERV